MENYRLVNLTSQACRVFERILQTEVLSQISSMLHPNQHGFLRNRSCLTNLLSFIEKITTMIDAGSSVDVIYLDFTKAFDKVPHRGLILKMRAVGLSEKIVLWVKEWLRNRKQRFRTGPPVTMRPPTRRISLREPGHGWVRDQNR